MLKENTREEDIRHEKRRHAEKRASGSILFDRTSPPGFR